MALVREIEKLVTPGMAMRRVEYMRQQRARARGEEGSERVVERSPRRLVAMGQRSLIQQFILKRLYNGSYETDPSPIPDDGWRGHGAWKVRDARTRRQSITALATKYNISPETMRKLVLQDPPIPHRAKARTISIEDDHLPLVEERVNQYRIDSMLRRGAASLVGHERRRQNGTEKISMTSLALLTGISTAAAGALRDAYPELRWIRRGRVTYLPWDSVPDFEALVESYKHAPHRGSPRPMTRVGLVPAFQDKHLSSLWERYIGGEWGLREQVYAEMRRAYEEAPECDREGG